MAFFVRRDIDETEQFVAKADRARQQLPLRELFRGADRIKSSIAMIVLTGVQNFGYYGVMIWLPGFLSAQYGFSVTKSAVWTGVTVIGMAIGILVFGWLADSIGRKPSLLIFQVGAAISVLVYSQLQDEMALLIGGAIMGVFVNGMLGGYGALMAELYPTEIRGTAQNVLFNIGRGIGGFGPIVVGALAAAFGFTTAIALLATIYVLDIIVTIFLIEERRGMELE